MVDVDVRVPSSRLDMYIVFLSDEVPGVKPIKSYLKMRTAKGRPRHREISISKEEKRVFQFCIIVQTGQDALQIALELEKMGFLPTHHKGFRKSAKVGHTYLIELWFLLPEEACMVLNARNSHVQRVNRLCPGEREISYFSQ